MNVEIRQALKHMAQKIQVPYKWCYNAAYNAIHGMAYRPNSQIAQVNCLMQAHEITWDDILHHRKSMNESNDARIKNLLDEKEQLNKEAEWLANILVRGCSSAVEDACPVCPAILGCTSCPCPREDCRHIQAKDWREAARKAVARGE